MENEQLHIVDSLISTAIFFFLISYNAHIYTRGDKKTKKKSRKCGGGVVKEETRTDVNGYNTSTHRDTPWIILLFSMGNVNWKW